MYSVSSLKIVVNTPHETISNETKFLLLVYTVYLCPINIVDVEHYLRDIKRLED